MKTEKKKESNGLGSVDLYRLSKTKSSVFYTTKINKVFCVHPIIKYIELHY